MDEPARVSLRRRRGCADRHRDELGDRDGHPERADSPRVDAQPAEAGRRRDDRRQPRTKQVESRQRTLGRDDRNRQEARRGVKRRSGKPMMRNLRPALPAIAATAALSMTVVALSAGRWLMQKGAPVPTPEEEYWS